MKKIAIVIALLVGAALLAAQAPKAPAPAPAAPALTEVESLKLENINLKFDALSRQMTELRQEYAALAAQLAAEHPGYALAPNGTLVPAPKKEEDRGPAKK
jgi:hypothetical protein